MSVHQLKEPEMCNNCNGDRCEPNTDHDCIVCDGEGGWPKGWYFWDETSCDRYGPYKSREEANEKCREYARQL